MSPFESGRFNGIFEIGNSSQKYLNRRFAWNIYQIPGMTLSECRESLYSNFL